MASELSPEIFYGVGDDGFAAIAKRSDIFRIPFEQGLAVLVKTRYWLVGRVRPVSTKYSTLMD
jgi:hypothetical protein